MLLKVLVCWRRRTVSMLYGKVWFRRFKSGCFDLTNEEYGRASRRIINIDCKAKSFWKVEKKTMLCVWRDHKGLIYYKLLNSSESDNTQRYRQQNHALLEMRPEWDSRHEGVILHHDNVPAQNQSRTPVLHFAGMSYSIRPTYQTWSLMTCLHEWDTRLLNSALVLTTKSKNVRSMVRFKRPTFLW